MEVKGTANSSVRRSMPSTSQSSVLPTTSNASDSVIYNYFAVIQRVDLTIFGDSMPNGKRLRFKKGDLLQTCERMQDKVMVLMNKISLNGSSAVGRCLFTAILDRIAAGRLLELDAFAFQCLLPVDTSLEVNDLRPMVDVLRSARPTNNGVGKTLLGRVRGRGDAVFRCSLVSLRNNNVDYIMVLLRNVAGQMEQDMCTIGDLSSVHSADAAAPLTNGNQPSTSASSSAAAIQGYGVTANGVNTTYQGTCNCVPLELTDDDDCFVAIGDRVLVELNGTQESATLKWLGRLAGCQDFSIDLLAGLELDKPIGTCSGEFHRHKLFQSRVAHGLVVESRKVAPQGGVQWHNNATQIQAPTDSTTVSTVLSTSANSFSQSTVARTKVSAFRASLPCNSNTACQTVQVSVASSKVLNTSANANLACSSSQQPCTASAASGSSLKRPNSSTFDKRNEVLAKKLVKSSIQALNKGRDQQGAELRGLEISKTDWNANVASAASNSAIQTASNSTYGSASHSKKSSTKVTKGESLKKSGVDDQSDCKVCFEAKKNALLQPCCHLALCFACAQNLQKTSSSCPICRATIQSVLRIFDA